MKKIMVYAYSNFNLGDDLFIKILCDRYPQVKFILYAPRKYKVLLKSIRNLSICPSNSMVIRGINLALGLFNVKTFCRRVVAKRCDAVVWIGGSLFIQGEAWRESINDTHSLRTPGHPFFLLGANFGPFVDHEFYLEHKELFKGFTDVCFRDTYSYELFKDLPNVRVANDIVFQLSQVDVADDVEISNNNIVFSVIKPSSRKGLDGYDDVYYKKLRDIAVFFMESGHTVTLMSFCESEGDNEAVKTILELIPRHHLHNISSFFYTTNLEEALRVIRKSSFVVATRFHAMILGWVYNKPVLPIAYSSKMVNVIQDVGFDGLYSDIRSIDSLNVEEVFGCVKTNTLDICKQANGSEEHFRTLDEYLLDYPRVILDRTPRAE